MFRFIKKVFISAMKFFSFKVLNVNPLECVSINNQKCKARPKIVNVNNNESVFCPYNIKVNKWSGSCNNINNLYAKLCIPDIIQSRHVKVLNLMQRINKTRHIIWHETCKCVCRLTSSFCNSRQIWNEANVDPNVKKILLTKKYVTKDLFGIQTIVVANVKNRVK